MDFGVIISLVIAVVLLYLVVKFLGLSFKFLWNGIFGAILLWVVNLIGGLVGIKISISIITALIAGFFGIPGVIVLLAYNIFCK